MDTSQVGRGRWVGWGVCCLGGYVDDFRLLVLLVLGYEGGEGGEYVGFVLVWWFCVYGCVSRCEHPELTGVICASIIHGRCA